MLGRTLLRLSSVDPGVDIQNVLITRVALSPSALLSPANIRAAWQDILNRVRHVPGVQSVACQPNALIVTDVGDAGLLDGDGHPSAPRPIL